MLPIAIVKTLIVILNKDSDKVFQMIDKKKPSAANFEVMYIRGRHVKIAYLAVFSFLNVQAQTQVSVK